MSCIFIDLFSFHATCALLRTSRYHALQVLMVGFMFPFGIGIALAVRLGASLPLSVVRAKKLTIGTLAASVVLFGTVSAMLYLFQDGIFAIFTTEEAVLEGAHMIWPKVCVYYFNLCIYALNMGIATGLGKQWMFGIVTVIFLWGLSLPSMYYLCIVKGGGLSTAWACITQPYIVMNAFLIHHFFWKEDWKEIQVAIRQREGMDEEASSALFLACGIDVDDNSRVDEPVEAVSRSGSAVNERTGLLLVESGRR